MLGFVEYRLNSHVSNFAHQHMRKSSETQTIDGMEKKRLVSVVAIKSMITQDEKGVPTL